MVPPADQERLVRAWRMHQVPGIDAAAERGRLWRKLDRLKLPFLAGGLDPAAYPAQLAALPADRGVGDGMGHHLAGSLTDVAAVWRAATTEERNKLARALFSDVVMANRNAVAVLPRPDLRPFFASCARALSSAMTHGRKRRGSGPHLPTRPGCGGRGALRSLTGATLPARRVTAAGRPATSLVPAA